MKKHLLKIHPRWFKAVVHPDPVFRKTVEIRSEEDRKFSVGDLLYLREWDEDYTGRVAVVTVTYCIRDIEYVLPNQVVMSIKLEETFSCDSIYLEGNEVIIGEMKC